MNSFDFDLNLWIPGYVLVVVLLGYLGVPLWLWSLSVASVFWLLGTPLWLWSVLGILTVVFNVPLVRQYLVTLPLMRGIEALNLQPKISETERAAIEAGTVWVDGELFSGRPDLNRLSHEPYPQVSPAVQAFLDGPVEQVCRMATDWEIYRRKDLPPAVWDYLKQERFFGLMIPQEYGGLGFSNLGYSAVMAKLASRSFTHVASVGVPNSLGPAKLLLHYGTTAQKAYYLPRLARGEEIPCFALTEPMAGSDAASLKAEGVVFKGTDYRLYLRLNWKKRYITLGAIATLIGLAFRLKDPENLLGKGEDLGITCALIPADTPGVVLNRRHDPMGVPFYNSPIEGHDVVVPVEQIIGGVAQAGQGWKMLMQSLAAGRGISFPATCAGVAQLVSRLVGNYGVVRQQFGLSIGRFEGIEEPLARIGGFTYLIEAARLYTVGAVDQGEQPGVISAIAKFQTTELTRQLVNAGMDILGGSGICRGPRNLLANVYTAMPIAITVEGANILSRSLIIFGQGAIRCHPYLYQEIKALENNDLPGFDRALWSHLGLWLRNGFRAGLLSLSQGWLARSPVAGPTARYYQKLAWASATFALLTDLVVLGFGGSLKRREHLTGRFADVLSWMYLGTATLRRFEAEGCQPADLPLVHWSMQYSFAQIEQAIEGILNNLSFPLLGSAFWRGVNWGWRLNPIGTLPSDNLSHQVAQLLQTPGESRDRLTAVIHLPRSTDEALGRLERAFTLAMQAEPIAKKVKGAVKSGLLPEGRSKWLLETALEKGIITREEMELLGEAQVVGQDAVQVDSFTLAEYLQGATGFSAPLSSEPEPNVIRLS